MSTEIPNKNSLAKGIATYFIEKMPINPNKIHLEKRSTENILIQHLILGLF